MWALGDTADLGKDGHALSPVGAAVYDILVDDPSFQGMDRDR